MTANIPLFSAHKANQGLDFNTPVGAVLNRHWYILGEETRQFECEFAAYVGVAHCIGVANGSDALELALKALGIGTGHTVLTVANAGFYASTAIHAVGATPMYAEIDDVCMTLSADAVRSALPLKPDAIVVTHLYGQLADIEAIVRIASQAGIPVLEDCAQAHGASRGGKQAGSFGTLACFSFYPTKNLGALGDGGAVVTDDEPLAAKVRQLRQYGWAQKYTVAVPGGRNSRLDEIQAAILRLKLGHLQHWNAQRRAIAQRYNHAFQGLPIERPEASGLDYVGHLYVIRVEHRDHLAAALKAAGVASDVHYPIADHHQPAYPVHCSLPVTERACDRVLSLPCFPGLTDEEVDHVIDVVTRYFG